MQFVKSHGTGNDFVLLPDPADEVRLTPALVRALCDRHRGLGGDGVIRLAPSPVGADVRMDYRNADGSLAEMCGNGVRCVAKYVADRAGTGGDVVRVDTRAGVKEVRVTERHGDGRVRAVRVDMGAPLAVDRGRMTVGGQPREVTTVSMGNPHVVLVADDVDDAPLAAWAREVSARYEGGVNVEVIAVPSRGRVRGRIFERGVGETLASGTGACAMAVAARACGLTDREVVLSLPGGDLEVAWTEDTVLMAGQVEEVASGTLDARWWASATAERAGQPA